MKLVERKKIVEGRPYDADNVPGVLTGVSGEEIREYLQANGDNAFGASAMSMLVSCKPSGIESSIWPAKLVFDAERDCIRVEVWSFFGMNKGAQLIIPLANVNFARLFGHNRIDMLMHDGTKVWAKAEFPGFLQSFLYR